MKKIITTVGTSLLTNALGEELSKNIDFIRTKGMRFEKGKDRVSQIEGMERVLNKYIKSSNTGLSAEIDSIIKIANEYKDDCEVYLLATDTIQSPICAEYIQKWFRKHKSSLSVHFAYSKDHIISGLIVSDANVFRKEGAVNLFNILEKIIVDENYSPYFILNITGGYKGVIPFLTIFGQINNIKIVYKYEDSDILIVLPQLPINVDYSLFVQYMKVFSDLKQGVEEDWRIIKSVNNLPDVFDNYVDTISERDSFLTTLNAIGEYFFNKINNYYIIDVNSNSKFFNEQAGQKGQIIYAIKELYTRLDALIKENNIKEGDLHSFVNKLGGKNDLRHGENPMSKTYIFKSTNKSQIRIVYSFNYNNAFLKIKLYDYAVGNFNHSTYIQEFKKKFSIKNEYDFITISIRKN